MKQPQSVKTVKSELSKYASLREQLAEFDLDTQCLLDTLEGETDLHEALLAVADEIADREADMNAIDMRVKDLEARKARHKRASDLLRAVILQAMEIGEIKTIQGSECTLTAKAKPQGLVINDEAVIPAKYWKPQDPKLDKTLLKTDLKDGCLIEGAMLDNGGTTLQIKRG